jgi:hypothetical protein
MDIRKYLRTGIGRLNAKPDKNGVTKQTFVLFTVYFATVITALTVEKVDRLIRLRDLEGNGDSTM